MACTKKESRKLALISFLRSSSESSLPEVLTPDPFLSPMHQSKTVFLIENGIAIELLFALFSRMEDIFVNEVRTTIKQ